MSSRQSRDSWLFAIFTFAAVALPSAYMVFTFSEYQKSAHETALSEQYAADIRYLDEVLTMSARMAAATGDTHWEDRYNAHVEELTAAIEGMQTLAHSTSVREMVSATDSANNALVALEAEAFALARAGDHDQASRLLVSAEYEHQKAVYARGIDMAIASARATLTAAMSRNWQSLLAATISALLGVLFSFVVWLLRAHRSAEELQRLNEALRAERDVAKSASEAKSKFLAKVSHELRTPLNAVIGYGEMLREDAEDQGRTNEKADLDRILNAGQRLLSLVNDLLDLAKVEAGKLELRPSEFDPRAMVESVAGTVAPLAASHGNVINTSFSDDLGTGWNDEGRLSQCLLNLLSNASKFTENGQIQVRARRDVRGDAQVFVFEVEDNGVGMTEEQLRTAFKPFVHAETKTSHPLAGAGLGLSIVREMAESLGGEVSVRSRLGEGSVFTIVAPVRLPQPSAQPRAMAA